MKKLILAALLALPAMAQQITVENALDGSLTGTLLSTNDTITIPALGSQYATVKLIVITAGTATATAQVSVDNATNFVSAPFGKRLTTVSANPTVQAISGTTLVTGDAWEFIIPSNATHFRITCPSGGTATTVLLSVGLIFDPGAPITGVLFDTTSAVNTAIDTGTIDLSGWEFVLTAYTTPAAGSGTISMVDDAGTSVTMFTVPASATAWYPFVVSSPSATQVTALPATGVTGALPILKRMRFQSAAVAAVTSRIRIEARR